MNTLGNIAQDSECAVLSLSTELLRHTLTLHHSHASRDLRYADAAVYGTRTTTLLSKAEAAAHGVCRNLPSPTHPEGLLQQIDEGLSESINPGDLVIFLNLLPPYAMPAGTFRRLWQYAHLVRRALARFERHHMNPVASDMLMDHNAEVLLHLMMWYKAFSFWNRHHTAALASATCTAFREQVRSILTLPTIGPPGSTSLDDFRSNALRMNWLNPAGVISGHQMILSPDVSQYFYTSRLLEDLDQWVVEDIPPNWLLRDFSLHPMTSYTVQELVNIDFDAHISWSWSASNHEPAVPVNCYQASLLSMRRSCGLPCDIPAIERSEWLWPVSPRELKAWRRQEIDYLARRRHCLLQGFRSLCRRAKAVGRKTSVNGVFILSHIALRRAEMVHALEKQQLLDIEFYAREVSAQDRVSYAELVELEVAAGFTAHHAALVPCICGTCPADHPVYGEYW